MALTQAQAQEQSRQRSVNLAEDVQTMRGNAADAGAKLLPLESKLKDAVVSFKVFIQELESTVI